MSREIRAVCVICENPFRLTMPPFGPNWAFDTFALGLAKCGVFERFSDSARNCTRIRSVTGNSRKSERSRLVAPGPRSW